MVGNNITSPKHVNLNGQPNREDICMLVRLTAHLTDHGADSESTRQPSFKEESGLDQFTDTTGYLLGQMKSLSCHATLADQSKV